MTQRSRMQIPRGSQSSSGQTTQWNVSGKTSQFKQVSPGDDPYQGYAGQNGHNLNTNKPKKKRSPAKVIFLTLFVLILLCGGLIAADFALNNDKIHHGVKVEGVDIGGMTKAEAVTEVQAKLDSKLVSSSVQVKPDAATQSRIESRVVNEDGTVAVAAQVESDGEQPTETAEQESDSTGENGETNDAGLSWSLNATELGASVDAENLVEEAYQVGQVNSIVDLFPALAQRLNSWLGQVDIAAELVFDEELLSAAMKPINDTIGIEMVNSQVVINEAGLATVQTGQLGEKVDQEAFKESSQDALLGRSSNTVETSMTSVALAIDDEAAQAVADQINTAIAEPVIFAYEGQIWTAETALLGSWVSTRVEGEGEAAQLIPQIDTSKGYDGIRNMIGDAGYGSAQNAYIDVSGGSPVIIGGTAGTGPDITTAVQDLTRILFQDTSAARQVTFVTAEVEPAVTADQVAEMGIVELIASFDLNYGAGEGTNRDFNIERSLDTLNGSIVAPGESWNWNTVVGRCDETTGYKSASIINADNEFSDAAGGGICNVATGVFNVAYEAGLPITERANHSIYLSRYPLGRDAAVSWEYPTLVFTNDTDHYIMVTATYDGVNMYLKIWGTSQNRTVDSNNSEWATTQDGGKTITNYRTVYNGDGSVRFQDSFYSYFPPEKKEE